ncbi:glycosyltransferase [uncultured Treponema sp.]|uniref:glycosyltransferase n=1 Tax=uncultured Treponema sp. TaxID=162155 RepID=UPI0015C00DA0|nr:glycosyltransferase [uncultured Treponema sp.]
MKLTPLISILMPTYNHEKYIAQAIKSALMQKTDFEWELLIHDDCSTDSTLTIARLYSEKHQDKIKLLTETKNQGLMKSYKKLIEASKGKYLAVLESDDYWLDENKLQMQVDFLENNPDFGISATDIIKVDKDGKEISSSKTFNNHIINTERWYENLLGTNGIHGACSVVFRKSDYEKFCNIDDWIKFGFKTFDHPAWLSISFNKKCKFLQKTTSAYRVLESSISNNENRKKNMFFNISCAEIEEYIISKFGYGSLTPKEYNQRICLCLMARALKLHQKEAFYKYARRLIPQSFKQKIMHCLPSFYYWQFIFRH